jgi:hypothetical protein
MGLLLVNVGCRGWIETPIVPDTTVTPQPSLLRVTKSDGAVITLRDFVIRNDSIVGFVAASPLVRTAVARTDVTKIEVRGDTTPRGVRTAGKIYLVYLAVAVLALAVVVSSLSSDLGKLP